MTGAGPDEFRSTSRFDVRRRLGSGGFGVVFEVFDRERKAVVALKALHQMSPRALYRFKQEFRSLADVSHPNLVALYELLAEEPQWFFTMELVHGCDLLTWSRGHTGTLSSAEDDDGRPDVVIERALAVTEAATPSMVSESQARVRAAHCDVPRVRASFRQLVEGVAALHHEGMLHRDIKPSNVLVTPQGRIVLLDFGLVRAVEGGITREGETIGTPAYMAPEQAMAGVLSPATDWYSVGVVLYEALTGQLPFSGRPADVLARKIEGEPPPASAISAGIPLDLDALCQDLLHREPERRPGAPEILERLGFPSSVESNAPAAAAPGSVLVGRQAHLDALWSAYAVARAGRAATVAVHGGSGMGKTALVRAFLGDLRAREPGAVVLAGRCYERESVPYKAVDPLMDALSRHLAESRPADAEALLPHDVLALARLFPVLRQVDSIARAKRAVLDVPDAQELRRRAFGAFREMMVRLADRCPLVLFIDDLHWGDADSAAILTELLRPPDPPALLLIGCYRTGDAERSGLLRALLPLREDASEVLHNTEVSVGPLSEPDARALALSVLGGQPRKEARPQADSIVGEAAGNPFFIQELALMFEASGADAEDAEGADGSPTLRTAVARRIRRLSAGPRRLLEVLAVAGQPLARTVATRAAALGGQAESAVAELRAQRLARTRLTPWREEIEASHDRVREAVLSALGAEELRALHFAIASALLQSGRSDAEMLAAHFELAGHADRAAEYALVAATNAFDALAFDRAARLYRMTLALRRDADPQRRSLTVRLGDALAAAGRGAEAAACYLAAAGGASAGEAAELHRRAAEQLLTSGHVDEGLRVVETVLSDLGMRLPSGTRTAVLSLVARRAALALRGLRFRERDASEIPARELLRIDTCWSVAVGLGMVDMLRGADFQARHLRLALRAGEPYRVSRALALETGYLAALGGTRTRHRCDRLAAQAAGLAERLRHPHAIGLAAMTAGVAAWTQGRWSAARRECERAVTVLRDRCTGAAWEIDMAEMYGLASLFFLGEVRELARRLPVLLKDAYERGDLLALTNLRIGFFSHVAWLAADDPARAREELRAGLEGWSTRRFEFPHIWARGAQRDIALYSGEPQMVPEPVIARWRALARSLDRFTQAAAILGLSSRARRRLAAATVSMVRTDREELLRGAEDHARRMKLEKTHWGDPLALMVRAGVAATRGDPDGALETLERAEGGFRAAEMHLHVAAARWRRGELVKGDTGRALISDAETWMAGQGIRNPPRMLRMLAPGAWRGA